VEEENKTEQINLDKEKKQIDLERTEQIET
jgi:hypothetical protein